MKNVMFITWAQYADHCHAKVTFNPIPYIKDTERQYNFSPECAAYCGVEWGKELRLTEEQTIRARRFLAF